jgi:hypothetical protein
MSEKVRNAYESCGRNRSLQAPGTTGKFQDKAREGEAATKIDRWHSSPGLQGPK